MLPRQMAPDDISAVIVKTTAPTVAKEVMILFNKSIQLGEVPSEWKDPQLCQYLKEANQTITQFPYCQFLVYTNS